MANARAIEAIQKKWARSPLSAGELYTLIGKHMSVIFEKLGIDPDQSDEVFNDLNAAYQDLAPRYVKPFENAIQLLTELKEMGKKTALITSNSRVGTNINLRLTKIEPNLFDCIVTSCDVEIHKPDPLPIKFAMEKLQVLPNEFIYIGDTRTDYEASMAANTQFKLMAHNQCEESESICESYHVKNFRTLRNAFQKSSTNGSSTDIKKNELSI